MRTFWCLKSLVADATVLKILPALNYTNNPHQDQQLHFFRVLERWKYIANAPLQRQVTNTQTCFWDWRGDTGLDILEDHILVDMSLIKNPRTVKMRTESFLSICIISNPTPMSSSSTADFLWHQIILGSHHPRIVFNLQHWVNCQC